MSANMRSEMAKTRALMTKTERDRISGREDVEKIKRYQAISRVRRRIEDELTEDITVLEEHHQGLLEEIRDVVCEDVEDEDIAESDSSEDVDETVVENDQSDIEAKEQVYEELEESVEIVEETREVEELLRDLDLPGSGSKYEMRINAVVTFYEHLRDQRGERVSKGDLKDLAENTDLDVGYASFESLWNNWVKANEPQGRDFNTLVQLPGVVMDGDDYVYTGDDDV